jgi:serine/threonine protein kinase
MHDAIGGRFQALRRLARGSSGEVFAVRDPATNRELALKRLLAANSGPASTARFMREYHALSGLRHPRIIEVYDYGVDGSLPYYAMELLDGYDLGALSPLPYREACGYLRDVASSLALLHARRLLHRDVSPRNVRRTHEGRCKLIDFGAMIPFGTPPDVIGTLPCLAPEALQAGPLDQTSDLYALGAVAYFALTGRLARLGELAEVITLRALDRPQIAMLSAALFGNVPNSEYISDLLFRTAQGNLKLTLELAERLLARGTLSYVALRGRVHVRGAGRSRVLGVVHAAKKRESAEVFEARLTRLHANGEHQRAIVLHHYRAELARLQSDTRA